MPSATTLKVTPLHNSFAAKVEGFDFSEAPDEQMFNELQEIIGTYGVVFFPETKLTDESQLDYSRRFGDLDSMEIHRKAGRFYRLPNAEIWDISNLDENGELIDGSDVGRAAAFRGNELFHQGFLL